MDYVKATSILIGDVTLKDLARETGKSHGVLRLARLDPSNPGYCNPPAKWESAVLKLARRRAAELNKLVDRLSSERQAAAGRGKSRTTARKKTATRRGRTTRRK